MLKYYLSVTTLALFMTGCNTDDIINPCKDLTVNAGADKTVQIGDDVIIRGSAESIGGTIVEQEWVGQDGSTLATTDTFTYHPTRVGNEILTFRASDDSGECTKEDSMVLTVTNSIPSNNSSSNTSSSTSNSNSSSSNSSTSSNTNNTNNSNTQTIRYEDLNTPYSWSNGDLGVKIASLRKRDDWITVTAVYKNLSSEDIQLRIYTNNTYLLDEDSNRWAFREDSVELSEYRGRQILPNRQIVTEMKFQAIDSTNGTVFDLIFDAYYEGDKFDHRIYSIHPF